ncbi:immune-associated nucleotide-binding protein 9 [Cryptomeria japonica]|uniref:immune-associated nucleotide-binding protein 9 n=1 Tax=Cryptomeria japonica TaxID=3369 RepID=UPI0027DA49F6|nr:immune-associated nucleotide-binding protein 9 [Cryptomeria japonica]
MRKVLFDNKTTSETKKEIQKTELMRQMDSIIAKNGGRPYSNEQLRQAQENLEKMLCRQTCHAGSGRTLHEDELERINSEHIKQLNATVDEKMQSIIKSYGDKLAYEKAARKEAVKIAEDALKLSKQIEKCPKMCENCPKMCEDCPLQGFCYNAWKTLSDAGCQIL